MSAPGLLVWNYREDNGLSGHILTNCQCGHETIELDGLLVHSALPAPHNNIWYTKPSFTQVLCNDTCLLDRMSFVLWITILRYSNYHLPCHICNRMLLYIIWQQKGEMCFFLLVWCDKPRTRHTYLGTSAVFLCNCMSCLPNAPVFYCRENFADCAARLKPHHLYRSCAHSYS